MKSIIIALAVMLCGIVGAEQRYNAFEDRYETVPNGSQWETKYNAFENEYSYQPKDAKTEYNAFKGKYEWDSGHNEKQL